MVDPLPEDDTGRCGSAAAQHANYNGQVHGYERAHAERKMDLLARVGVHDGVDNMLSRVVSVYRYGNGMYGLRGLSG